MILLLLIFFLITSLFSSFSNLGTGGVGSLAASTYLADDTDINNAEVNQVISSEQAWYLREKYLRIERE